MRKAPSATLLTSSDINEALKQLPNWLLINHKLHKEFYFKNFSEAFAFMTRVAIESEVMNHHPEWHNSYNVVTIDLYHHVKGGITNLDVELALDIERILEN